MSTQTATNSMTYRRAAVTRHCEPDVLQMMEVDLPVTGPDQVRVKALVAGISAYDLMHRCSGSIPGSPKPPFTLGEDVTCLVS